MVTMDRSRTVSEINVENRIFLPVYLVLPLKFLEFRTALVLKEHGCCYQMVEKKV